MAEMTVWEKVEKWVVENRNEYFKYTDQQISKEIGIPIASVRQYLPFVFALHNKIDLAKAIVLRQEKTQGHANMRKSLDKIMTVWEKVEKWVMENPDGYLEYTHQQIGNEIGIPLAAVRLHLPFVIAKRDGIYIREYIRSVRMAKARDSARPKMSVRQKIQAWVQKNPEGYLEKTFKQISKETGVSEGSVNGHLTKIIAERDGILPSDVTAKRVAEGFRQSPLELPEERVAQIRKLHDKDKRSVADISYITKCCEATVRKYLRRD